MLPTQSTAADRAPRAAGRGGAPRLATVLLLIVAVGGMVLLWRGLHPGTPPDAPLPASEFDRRGLPAAPAAVGPPTPGSPPAYGPNRLGIPSLGVDAPLVPESVRAGGDLVIPGDPGTVGRWRDGAALTATAGTTLLAGHVSVAGVGDGALRSLHRIEPGALVVTTDDRGTPRRWRVDALLVRAKDALPAFPSEGPRRLAIVTCGGPLLRTADGNTYRDNVIAYATPMAAAVASD